MKPKSKTNPRIAALQALSAAIEATEENIARARRSLGDLEKKLARQHAEFYRQTMQLATSED